MVLMFCCWQSSDGTPSLLESGLGGANNFATIRTTSIVTQQQRAHIQENMMRQQMTGYKALRRQHQKQMQQVYSSRIPHLMLPLHIFPYFTLSFHNLTNRMIYKHMRKEANKGWEVHFAGCRATFSKRMIKMQQNLYFGLWKFGPVEQPSHFLQQNEEICNQEW